MTIYGFTTLRPPVPALSMQERHQPAVLLGAVETFRERTRDKRLIILYPLIQFRNLFLSQFLKNASDGLMYYRVRADQTTLRDFLTGLQQEFEAVLGSFGRALNKALRDPDTSPQELGKALAKDLNTFAEKQSSPVILYLDELDRLPTIERDFSDFMTELVHQLSGKAQLAISSRMLSRQPYLSLVQSGHAVVLGTEIRRDDILFTVEPEPRPQLEVMAFGRGHALVDGKPITNWDGALPRNLFFYFIDRPLVTRADIFETFWPNLPTKEATNVFHVTKRKISERISMKINDGLNYELTQYVSGYYLPSEKLMRHYDVADFMDAVQRAEVENNDEREQMALYMRAIDLYRAPFLQTIDMPWIVERRRQLRDQFAAALIAVGTMWHERGNLLEALGFFARAVRETPEREDIHRSVISIYLALDMPEDAVRQFRRLEQVLADYRLTPSQETLKLVEKLRIE